MQSLAEGEAELMYVRAEWSELNGCTVDLLHPAAEMMTRLLQGQQVWVLKYDPQFLSAKKQKMLPAPEPEGDDSGVLAEDLPWRNFLHSARDAVAKNPWGVSESMFHMFRFRLHPCHMYVRREPFCPDVHVRSLHLAIVPRYSPP